MLLPKYFRLLVPIDLYVEGKCREEQVLVYFILTFVVKHKTKIKSINNIKSVLLSQQDLEGRKHLH